MDLKTCGDASRHWIQFRLREYFKHSFFKDVTSVTNEPLPMVHEESPPFPSALTVHKLEGPKHWKG